MKQKRISKFVAVVVSAMLAMTIATPAFAASEDKLISSEFVMQDGVTIQEDTYIDKNGSTYKALKTSNKTEAEFEAVKKYNMKKAQQLKTDIHTLPRVLIDYETRYFYDFEYSPSSNKVSSEIFGNWFQAFENGCMVLGIKENSQAIASNSSYGKIIMDETIRYDGVNLSLSFGIPESTGFSLTNERNVYLRHSDPGSGYGSLVRNFDYAVSATASMLALSYESTYINHVDGYINGNPHEAITSTNYVFDAY